MKQTIISIRILLFTTLAFLYSCSGEQSTDEKIESFLNEKYPGLEKVEIEKEGNEWEVDFKYNGAEMSAEFDEEGIWEETESDMKVENLPENIRVILNEKYHGADIEDIEFKETPKLKAYEIELELNNTEIELLIDGDGQILKEEKEVENEVNY